MTRKKIIVVVLAGCVIATAIAVPVGVSAHLQQLHREASKKALASLIFQNNQDAAHIQRINTLITSDLRQESVIQQQLGQSNLTQSQVGQLRSDLQDLQGEVRVAQQSESLIISSRYENTDCIACVCASFE